MRYRVGDLVRVRKDLNPGNDYPYEGETNDRLFFNPSMKKFRGKIGRITKVTDDELDEYLISIDDGVWYYNNAMLMPVLGLSYLISLRKEL